MWTVQYEFTYVWVLYKMCASIYGYGAVYAYAHVSMCSTVCTYLLVRYNSIMLILMSSMQYVVYSSDACLCTVLDVELDGGSTLLSVTKQG